MTVPPPLPVREEAAGDPGLQVQRTVLSWYRTVATAAAATALGVHHAVTDRESGSGLAVAALTVCAVTIAVVGFQRRRRLPHRAHVSAGPYLALVSGAVALPATVAVIRTVARLG
ncbi:DUF202 domain-containing protein [Rhodococcus artemisiae]|uniref:DUF202 domain-containing protein n=1 Tax=Rhodococcus artemisiae TaxID=714159 RepID=A0ABU7LAK7_9NOCA|nr:DUF202 domain-containing protein [Rhodococcus artemisiae]MEE2058588.1 hypothetical protein [Rhodococcus artemisiae]